MKTPPRAFRRGDWYARKETRRGDETVTMRPEDAPGRFAFALCLSFQVDYQSSCGSTTGGIIANFRGLVRNNRQSCRQPPRSDNQSPQYYTQERRENDSVNENYLIAHRRNSSIGQWTMPLCEKLISSIVTTHFGKLSSIASSGENSRSRISAVGIRYAT